ncbi:MAG: hypothetical protein INQ03_05120 [Candidatus Heimdallarchaeota archaeon]|nr:hypothetical protein [Candidatus Heimdallarchaeota archaeon]
MIINILCGFKDIEFFRLIEETLNPDEIKCTLVKSGVTLLDEIQTNDYNVIVLGDILNDMSGYQAITNIMKTKPLPCLIIYNEDEPKQEVDYPYALDYGIVASLELAMSEGKIRFPNLIRVRINILNKMNIERFTSQIEQINRSKKKHSFEDPKLRGKIHQIREQTTIQKVLEKKGKVDESEIFSDNPDQVVVIGASTGGPKTLMYIVAQFPKNFPPVLIVQHMPEGFIATFASRMDTITHMKTHLAKEGMVLKNGNVYVAPGGRHMELERSSPRHVRIRITDGAKVNYVKPAVDVTLFAAARSFEERVTSVILTGMGSDGRNGTRAVKKLGGYCIALCEEESIIYGMNKAVIDAGLADEILGMDHIVISLVKRVRALSITNKKSTSKINSE